MNFSRNPILAVIVGSALMIGCDQLRNRGSERKAEKAGKTAVAQIAPAKAASTQPAFGQATGKVTFTQMDKKVHVVAELTGVPPGKHGIHVHEKGDLSAPDLTSAGGHFNPGHHPHGGPTTSAVHEGDLGNITADASGNAKLDLTVTNITVGSGSANDIVGRSVIIHAKPDDFSTQQPPGNAGARIAGGVIQLSQ